MPFSQSTQISAIVQSIESLKPISILDIGMGMGQYGYLSRMYLENVNLFEIDGNYAKKREKKDWKIKIDGIEGFKEYITEIHTYCYNNLIIGEALEELKKIKDNSYELLLAIDILEHFEKKDGELFLRELQRVTSKYVIVSTPKKFILQEIDANPYENHRSLWNQEDFLKYKFKQIIENDISWIVILEKEKIK